MNTNQITPDDAQRIGDIPDLIRQAGAVDVGAERRQRVEPMVDETLPQGEESGLYSLPAPDGRFPLLKASVDSRSGDWDVYAYVAEAEDVSAADARAIAKALVAAALDADVMNSTAAYAIPGRVFREVGDLVLVVDSFGRARINFSEPPHAEGHWTFEGVKVWNLGRFRHIGDETRAGVEHAVLAEVDYAAEFNG